MKFSELALHKDLQKGIDEAGYLTCMPVQEQVLSNAFGGRDLYVQSQTGTGKTAAFLIVIFQRILADEALRYRKALILAPTRELAVQIEEEAKTLGKFLRIRTGCFYGGVGYAEQEKLLRDNVQILTGTPGRVLDLCKSGKMNLMEISFLVIDEADRMFDMGFYPDLRTLINLVPQAEKRQTMLFSATLNTWVKNLAWEYTKSSKGGVSPFEITIKPETVTVDEITQVLYHVPSAEKMRLLLGVLKHEQPESAIVFCNTKKQTEITAKRLRMNGYPCEYIIGDMQQAKRLNVIKDLKAGKIKTLVATDVAARGLDIESLAMVINYDVPKEPENYIHRIGRTARAGKTGKAVSFASEQDVYDLPAIERYIGQKIPSKIAAKEYFEEDTSTGRYIQTEFFGNVQRKNSRKDTKTRTYSAASGTNSAASGTNSAASSTYSEASSARKEENKIPQKRGEDIRKKKGFLPKSQSSGLYTQKQSAKDMEALPDLSLLSMEERMALYKKKYAGGHSDYSGQKTPDIRSPREIPRAENNLSSRNKYIPDAETEQSAAQKETAPVKKGLISKLKGLFKRK